MTSTESVKHFCENVPSEESRETALQYFGPADATTSDETVETPAVLPGFDNNLSDVRTETGCQYFGGGKCEKVTGWSSLPACFAWTPEDVADWIEVIGFPLYRVSLLNFQ